MKKSKTNKAADSIAVPKDLAQTLIPQIQEQIERSKQHVEKDLLPTFRKIEQQYLELKKPIDEEQKKIADSMRLVETILRNSGKEGRSISMNVKIGSKIPWTVEYETVFKVEQRLMKFEDLFQAVLQRHPLIKEMQHNVERTMSLQKHNMVAGEKDTIERIKKGTVNRRGPEFLSFGGKWGLREWFNTTDPNKITPLPKYVFSNELTTA